MLLPMYVPTCSGCNGKSSLLLTPLLVSCVIFGNALQSARDQSFPNVVSLVVDEGGVASIANDASSDAVSMSVAEGSARTKNSRRFRRRGLTGTLARKHTKGADEAAKIEQALEHIRELRKEAALAKEELEELLQENDDDGDGDDDDDEVDDDDDDDGPDVVCGPGGDTDCEDIDGDETDEESENDDDTEDACPVRYYVSQKRWQTYVQKGEAYTENGYSPTGWVLGDSGKSFLAWEMDTGTLKEFKTTGDSFYAYSALEPGTTQWTIRNARDRYLILESDNVEEEWHGWRYYDSFFTSSSPPPGCEEDEGGTPPAPPPVPAPQPTGPAPSPTGPAPSPRNRGAMIWDAACPDRDEHYQRTNDLIFEKYYPSGVDMWAYMAYELRKDSTFNTQIEWAGMSRPGCGRKMEEKGIVSLRDDPRNRGRVKQFPAIIICDQGCRGGIDHLRTLIRSEEKKTNFITAAVQRMKELRFDGYDIDWEVAHGATNPPSQDSQDFTQFLQEFSAALKAEGGSLGTAMQLGSASVEYVGMSTTQLLNAGWDRLVSMGTYGAWGNFNSFKSMVQLNWNRLGEKYAVGANVNPRENNGCWLGDEARKRFQYLKDHFPGIKRIGVWHAYRLAKPEAESFLQHLRDWVEDR